MEEAIVGLTTPKVNEALASKSRSVALRLALLSVLVTGELYAFVGRRFRFKTKG